ncbi:uncharacterized protein LOC124141717 isoform X1 [Haliotis rufescens]|uniref:uncharacterized protein LOC124141717 isoform X1 n=1 Tax=Haliotis rufescens TaxID=6454 RepID=UPI001EB02E4D|nr:uncharacterized protein LOC124141717 isoform X1 [Haliotis rufescens]
MFDNSTKDDWQELIDLWDYLLQSDVDPELAIQAVKGSMSSSVNVAEDHVHVADVEDVYPTEDTPSPLVWPKSFTQNLTGSGDVLRPPTPIWIEGRYTPVFNTASKVISCETPVFNTAPAVISSETSLESYEIVSKTKKASRLVRFFRGVCRLFSRTSNHKRCGWNRL